MKIKESLKLQFLVAGSFNILLILLAMALFIGVKWQSKDIVKLLNEKECLFLVSNELKQSSEDLTRLCRLFVATGGDKEYLEEYNKIVAWRSGQIPRPETVDEKISPGRRISQIKLLKEFGCTDEELELLKESSKLSEKLVLIERQAMESMQQKAYVEGPCKILPNENYSQFATRIVNDRNYNSEIKKIMKPINKFFTVLESRTSSVIEKNESKLIRKEAAAIAFMDIVILSFITIVILFYRTILSPIFKTSKVLVTLGDGNLTEKLNIKSKNEIGLMSGNLNTMVSNIRDLIFVIQKSTESLSAIGEQLSGNMTETASSINEISSNIEGVKQQAFK